MMCTILYDSCLSYELISWPCKVTPSLSLRQTSAICKYCNKQPAKLCYLLEALPPPLFKHSWVSYRNGICCSDLHFSSWPVLGWLSHLSFSCTAQLEGHVGRVGFPFSKSSQCPRSCCWHSFKVNSVGSFSLLPFPDAVTISSAGPPFQPSFFMPMPDSLSFFYSDNTSNLELGWHN